MSYSHLVDRRRNVLVSFARSVIQLLEAPVRIPLVTLSGLLFSLALRPALAAPAGQVLSAAQNSTADQLLLAARQYANHYIASLPSFVCLQTTEQFEAGKRAKHWRKGDRLTAQLVWDQGREQRTLKLINNRPASSQSLWRAPLVSEGEFGNLLDSILGDSSTATLQWRGWDTVGEKRLGVIEYNVEREHSPWQFGLGAERSQIAFHGLVYADNSGTVWRVTNDAADFPPALKTKSIARSVDYGDVVIGSNHYVLPLRATILLDTGNGEIRNELHFDAYRKFGVESHISFSSDEVSKNNPGDGIKR